MKTLANIVLVLGGASLASAFGRGLGLDAKLVALMGLAGATLGAVIYFRLYERSGRQAIVASNKFAGENFVYVQIYCNRVRALDVRSGAVVVKEAERPFSTNRLLVGDFKAYEATLKCAMTELRRGQWWPMAPKLLVHPMDTFPDGFSEVEYASILEGCMGARAHSARIYLGRELKFNQVKEAYSKSGAAWPLAT